MQVNVLEAKTQLSKLIERAEAGEEVVIARAGRPVVRLLALHIPAAAATTPTHIHSILAAEGLIVRAARPPIGTIGGQGTATLESVLADLSQSREER